MNKIETIIYGLVKEHPGIKKFVKTLYQGTFDLLPRKAEFFSGEYDYNCPWELVEDYCGILDSPQKSFYKIPDSAHSPLWENPKETCDILKQIKEKFI